jgi:drug/metabolite transporter (DMT)-like permease
MRRSSDTLGLLLGFVGVLIFGATLPFTRIAVGWLDPWFVTTGRAALAGLVAAMLLVVLRRPIPTRDALWRYALVALLLAGGFPGFTGFAMRLVPASHGGVVLGILPLATAAVGALVTRERPSLQFWICAVLGAAIVVAFALRDGAGRVDAGDLLLAGAVASAACGYVVSAQLARERPGWEVISWVVVVALPVTLPVTLLTAPVHPLEVPARAWLAFVYLGLMSQYLGFFAWNAGLALGGVARVSQVQLLQTFVTLGVAALLQGEQVDVITWLSAVAVVVVVMIGRRARVARPG